MITQLHSMGRTQCKKCSVLVRSRFICSIRPNRGLAVEYFPFWDNREQKQDFQVNYHSVFRALKSPREVVHAQVRYNSPQHCTDRVRAGQTSSVIFWNRRLPRKCLQRNDDIMTSEAKYLLCDGSTPDLRQQTDSRLSWQVFGMTSPVYMVAKLPVVITSWICFPFHRGIRVHSEELSATFRRVECFFQKWYKLKDVPIIKY